ncbi:MAG: chromosome partitioning protein Smc [Meiothermus sp.]|nr:MAG: chromosome partitioning protein Smc [Meiothermus sp.]
MKIERLFLQGFKSFGERTSLEFGPGVYGIVGPNGSGKSNLVEALRWVVGARAKELRGDEAQALLFHGSDGRPPLGFAEVGLELGGNGKRISLSRRLERDGSSEIRLNSARSTLRQVEQALMGTGLSRSGYAIVGQGEVGQILQAGPEVLLAYLEEAAGLRAVTQASKATQERLQAATLELQTRTQELAERKAIISEKAQQAEAARQAAALAARTLLLRRSVLAARIREAEQEVNSAQQKAQTLEREQAETTQRLQAIEKEKGQALEALEAAQNAHSEALRQAEALSGELKLVEQERASLEGLLRRIAGEIGEGETRLIRLRSLQAPIAPADAPPTPAALQSLQQQLKELQAAIQNEENQIRSAQKAYERFLQAQATYEAQKASFEQMLAQRAALEADQARLEAERTALQAQLSEAQLRESTLRSRLNELVRQEGQASSEARAARSEAGRLEALLRSGADLAEGPKRARASGIPGLMGVVADLIEVPAGLELAVEVALGARMQWVLCEDERAAQAAVQYLKQQGGRATFLPRTLLKPPRARHERLPWTETPGVVGVARHLVQLPLCPEALPTLLGETLVLEHLEAALALVRQHPDHPRIVTLEGELLETSGAITGGRLQKGGQMLALRRRFHDTQSEAARLEAQALALAAQAEQLRAELASLNLTQLQRRQTELDSELKAVRASLARLPALGGQAQPPQPPEPVLPPNPQRLEALRSEREALGAQLAQQREAELRWQRYREDQARYATAQNEIAELEARLQHLRGEQAELGQRLAALQSRKDALERDRAQLSLGHLEERLRAARGRTRALSEEETRLIARTNALLSDLEALHLTQARREATIETLQQELSALPPGPIEEGSSRSLARLLAETEAALEALGPVNHLAEQEYALLSEDIARLEVALQESEAAVRKLEAELHQVASAYQERMQQVYGVFKEKFAQYAGALLDAEVELERSTQGLELILKPAGKRTVNLNLLSMGERTMGALAFLFALSEVGEESSGLPIAVLDEVDAPLDEANIQRFCRFLQHFKNQTQFILVTHQKRTMEACDALYGVTTEKGVSRVYSIKREEALA